MTAPHDDMTMNEMPEDLHEMHEMLDALGDGMRSGPDAGFESRLVAASLAARPGAQGPGAEGPRLVHEAQPRGGRVERLHRRWLAPASLAAAMLVVASVLAVRMSSNRLAPADSDMRLALVAHTDLDEIAEAWDILDDQEIWSVVSSLRGEASTLQSSMQGDWVSETWNSEDPM
ncbi:MAG: hypothetical protein KF838_04095 [Phycisphaeraceae bacterium]|nr:MAG: hypothetical protein KF838_04095 [Phycisphaeraceae bacterium]